MATDPADTRFDVIIVGNGILGLSLAAALLEAEPRLSLAVIGPALRPGGATVAAGAMINVWAEAVTGQFEDPVLAARAQFGLDALRLWDGACERLRPYAPAPLRVTWGTRVVAGPAPSPAAHAIAAYVRGALPGAGAAGDGDLLLPDGAIDPLPVLAAYERLILAKGGQILDDTVEAIAPRARGHRVLRRRGSAEAPHLVLANGSFAQALIDPHEALRQAMPRLVWGMGAAFDVALTDADPPDLLPALVVRTLGPGSIHLVPLGPRRAYFGATSAVLLAPPLTTPGDLLAPLRQRFLEAFPRLARHARLTPRAPGFRPTTADGFPLLGETALEGLWLANGMKRDGFTASPALARALAAEILGRGPHLPACFRPLRPLLSYKTRPAAIAETLEAADTPWTGQTLDAVYERRGLGAIGIAPDLVPLYADDEAFARIAHPPR